MKGKTAESSDEQFFQKLINRLEIQSAMKAGVAASLSLYLGVAFAKWLQRPDALISGTWCVMSTFVVLQAHLGGTYRAAWVRFLGVLIGSFMGGLFTSMFGSNAITLGVGVVLTVLACSLFKIKDSIRIACLSVSIVMILWGLHPSISPWQFGWYRFLDSSLGILIAVFVSHILWPTKATLKLRLSVANTVSMINRLFQMELSQKTQPQNFDREHRQLSMEIEESILQAENFLVDSELEVLSRTKRIEEWSNLLDHLSAIFDATKELNTFHTFDLERILDENLSKKLYATINTIDKTMNTLVRRLKREYEEEPSQELREAVNALNEELARFRTTRTTRKYERHEVEKFFVFFYNLRIVIEELIKMDERTFRVLKR